MTMDKWMLWGAVAVMASVGSLSVWKIRQTPSIDPEIVRLGKALEVPATVVKNPAPPLPPLPAGGCGPSTWVEAGRVPMKDWTGFIATKAVGTAVAPPKQPVYILPLPVIQRQTVADLDGVTISWTLRKAEPSLLEWMVRNEAKPAGFIVERMGEDGNLETLATLGPNARTYTDLAVEARRTYRYWVSLTGKETDLTKRPLQVVDAVKSLPESAEASTPSGVRMKLIGGDKLNALLRVETYDREKHCWVQKTMMAAPGRKVGRSGWTLTGLHFDNFTLVADLLDDDGAVRVLTTKN